MVKNERIMARLNNLLDRYFDAMSFIQKSLYYIHQDDRIPLLNQFNFPKHWGDDRRTHDKNQGYIFLAQKI